MPFEPGQKRPDRRERHEADLRSAVIARTFSPLWFQQWDDRINAIMAKKRPDQSSEPTPTEHERFVKHMRERLNA